MENKYWYSEGYIYKGNDTICQLFGTEEENKEIQFFICKSLNIYEDSKVIKNTRGGGNYKSNFKIK